MHSRFEVQYFSCALHFFYNIEDSPGKRGLSQHFFSGFVAIGKNTVQVIYIVGVGSQLKLYFQFFLKPH